MYQGTTSVVLFCQPAGNDGNENTELRPRWGRPPACGGLSGRPVFSGVPTITLYQGATSVVPTITLYQGTTSVVPTITLYQGTTSVVPTITIGITGALAPVSSLIQPNDHIRFG
jgi:hypothetical protein